MNLEWRTHHLSDYLKFSLLCFFSYLENSLFPKASEYDKMLDDLVELECFQISIDIHFLKVIRDTLVLKPVRVSSILFEKALL